jgi:hypothetical protein
MTSASVWVQLYYEGGAETIGQAKEIRPIPKNVDALKVAVHAKFPRALTHCDDGTLKVYAAGTAVPILEGTESLNPGGPVPTDTTSDSPLVVTAPKPQLQQQQSGTIRCCLPCVFS